MYFVMNHAPGAGSMAWPVGQQSAANQKWYPDPLIWKQSDFFQIFHGWVTKCSGGEGRGGWVWTCIYSEATAQLEPQGKWRDVSRNKERISESESRSDSGSGSGAGMGGISSDLCLQGLAKNHAIWISAVSWNCRGQGVDCVNIEGNQSANFF